MFNMSHTYFETCRHILFLLHINTVTSPSTAEELVLIVIAGTDWIRYRINDCRQPHIYFWLYKIVRRPEGRKSSLHNNVLNKQQY